MSEQSVFPELRQIKRDLEFYMKEYDLNQKEAYELIHERYYIRMMLTKSYVEIEARDRIYKSFKTKEGESEQ